MLPQLQAPSARRPPGLPASHPRCTFKVSGACASPNNEKARPAQVQGEYTGRKPALSAESRVSTPAAAPSQAPAGCPAASIRPKSRPQCWRRPQRWHRPLRCRRRLSLLSPEQGPWPRLLQQPRRRRHSAGSRLPAVKRHRLVPPLPCHCNARYCQALQRCSGHNRCRQARLSRRHCGQCPWRRQSRCHQQQPPLGTP